MMRSKYVHNYTCPTATVYCLLLTRYTIVCNGVCWDGVEGHVLTQLMPPKDVLMPDLKVQFWPALQSFGCQVKV